MKPFRVRKPSLYPLSYRGKNQSKNQISNIKKQEITVIGRQIAEIDAEGKSKAKIKMQKSPEQNSS